MKKLSSGSNIKIMSPIKEISVYSCLSARLHHILMDSCIDTLSITSFEDIAADLSANINSRRIHEIYMR